MYRRVERAALPVSEAKELFAHQNKLAACSTQRTDSLPTQSRTGSLARSGGKNVKTGQTLLILLLCAICTHADAQYINGANPRVNAAQEAAKFIEQWAKLPDFSAKMLAVLPFKGDKDEQFLDALRDALSDKEYNLVPKAEVEDWVKKEIVRQQTDWIAPKTAAKIGTFHAADTVIGGRVRDFGTGRVHVEIVNIQTLDTRTTTVEGTSDTHNLVLRVVLASAIGIVALAFCGWLATIIGYYRWLIFVLGIIVIILMSWYLVLQYIIR